MKTLPCYLMVVLIGCQSTPTSSNDTVDEAGLLRVYGVNRTVADFPVKEDFSTPEAAYAVINRVIASGDQASWRRISTRRLSRRLSPPDAERRDVTPKEAQEWLNARIIEVRGFRRIHAAVIAELASDPPRFDCRFVDFEDGRWLNNGHGLWDSLEQAREVSFRGLGGYVQEKPLRPKIEDPEAYLRGFVDFLATNGEEPKSFVMKALPQYPIVIMGETHHRPRYWAFNSSLVSDPDFSKAVGTIYMELPSNDQVLIDEFLTADQCDTTLVIEMLRDMLWMGWPDQPMLDFFMTAWMVNRRLAADERIRIVLVDMQRPWKNIRERRDAIKYETDRDRLMADNIIRDIREHPEEERNALFIVGIGHAMLNLKYFDQATPIRSAGFHLRQEFGADGVYAIFPHTAVQTNVGDVWGRLCLGLFDSAFAAFDNKPLAFPLTAGPFGEQMFDALPDKPTSRSCRYRDGYSAYLYLGPLEDEIFSPLIAGFYTDEFVKELDRRHRIMFGEGLVKGCGLPTLDAESFIGWMTTNWGKPRRDWQPPSLGPMDAWHFWHVSGDWREIIRKQKHAHAFEHPEVIVDAARKLVDAIRTVDYDDPKAVTDALRDRYTVATRFDLWVQWICRTFKENPIESVEFGEVFKGRAKGPTIPYKLTLEDGSVLQGNLPFDYEAREQTWCGWHGLDWHLKNEPLRPPG